MSISQTAETACKPTSDVYTDAAILAALLQADGLGARILNQLLRAAGCPEALWQASDAFLREYLSDKLRVAFKHRRDQGFSLEWIQTYGELGIRVLPVTDPDYPPLLREIHDPPLVLYIKGNPEALTGKTLAVVGTRRCTDYGQRVTETLIGELGPDVRILSGLAAGVDTVAHAAALEKGLLTAAVFGCGLDIIFPTTNRKLSEAIVASGGALVSEYPLGVPGNKYTYPQRNRVVAGLSHGVLVTEGDVKSGALITARLAVEEGRMVFAVPGDIYKPGSQGPLYLIKHGAVPVSRGREILQELGWWEEAAARQTAMSQLGLALADGSSEEFPGAGEVGQGVSGNRVGGFPRSGRSGLGPGTGHGTAERFLPSTVVSLPETLSETERQLMTCLGSEPVSVDVLPQASGLSAAQVNELLTLLELEGLVVLLPGAKVCRTL